MNVKPNSKELFTQLKEQIINCRLCQRDFGFEPKPVFWGNQTAKIVHISQAPSLNVYKTQRPFNDKSGEKLRKEWYQVTDEEFYNSSLFYITAIAHCYPGKNKSGGDKKPPKVCAEKWLKRELKLLKPKLFLVLGNYAANFFFPKRKLSELVFENLKVDGVPCFVLPHPSPQNIKWFKDYPEFEKERLSGIREGIRKAIES